MNNSILIIEDDPMIRQLITIYMEKEGYDVYSANDGEEGMVLCRKHSPCLVILDLMLPKVSGEEICQWIRQEWKEEIAIIMLTAKVSEAERVAGLRMGADDYMTKPFSPNELMARVESVLRRTGQYCQKITYHGLTIKPRKGEVTLHSTPLQLTSSEFTLLYYFMRNPNQVISREQLIQQLYPMDEKEVNYRTIDVHISNLREKIEQDPTKPTWIQTVRGMGYKFVV